MLKNDTWERSRKEELRDKRRRKRKLMPREGEERL